jgi:predicted nucleic acid-binding protein
MDDIDLLLDTDVLVDLLRRFPPAVRWAREHASSRLGIPVIVYLEILQGARNQHELDSLAHHLDAYTTLHLQPEDSARAACSSPRRLYHPPSAA